MARWWLSHECHGCKHRNGAWCGIRGLPCTVNPILTFRHGLIGMACMGAGRDDADQGLRAEAGGGADAEGLDTIDC
jgi:hypothetical protein